MPALLIGSLALVFFQSRPDLEKLQEFLEDHGRIQATRSVTNKVVVTSINASGMSYSIKMETPDPSIGGDMKTTLMWSNVASTSVLRVGDVFYEIVKVRKPVVTYSPSGKESNNECAFPFKTREEANTCNRLFAAVVKRYGKGRH